MTVIIEAKKGWLLPGEAQLTKYLPRVTSERQGLLVSLSDSSTAWAARVLPDALGGVPVRHLIRDSGTRAETCTGGVPRAGMIVGRPRSGRDRISSAIPATRAASETVRTFGPSECEPA